MTEVKARLERMECMLRVSGAPETANRSVVIAAPTKVQWSAYLNRIDGRVYAAVTVYGNTPEGDPWNTSFLPDFEDTPSWIPEPPAWYVDAVAKLRAAAEDPSREWVAR